MHSIKIDGKNPLNGSVTLSGSAISASKIILASLFTTEDVILQNVPRVGFTENDVDLIQALGGECVWLDKNKLRINTSGVNTHRIPYELGSKNRISLLAAGPLVFRFGKAFIPKPLNTPHRANPIDLFISVWKDLGFKVTEDKEWLMLEMSDYGSKNISFKSSTHMGTENAILSSLFMKGNTIINNAAEEPEIDDLIDFLNLIGGSVKRIESRKIEVVGSPIYKGCSFDVQNDKNEIIFFAVGALVTGGTVTIKNVNKITISSFLNVLNNIGANFEFQGRDITVWHSGEKLSALNVSSGPAPGLITDWMPALCVLATHSEGASILTENVYANSWEYVRDLNRMGANVRLMNEPTLENSIKIEGPTLLRGLTLDVEDIRSGVALFLAALSADGSSDIRGFDNLDSVYEDIIPKLQSLGAKITSGKNSLNNA